MQIAISYRRTDDSETLKMLVDALKTRFGERNIYLDVESARIGESWVSRWSQAYIAADCILVVIGPTWNPERLREEGDAVRIELSGSMLGWERFVPVLIDGGVLPKRTQLPLTIRPLVARQGYVIDSTEPAQSIAHFLERLERDKQPPPGWQKLLMKRRTHVQPTSLDLTGEWKMQSAQPLFTEMQIRQNGRSLNVWALGAYRDEIVGDGFVAIDRPSVMLTLTSKQYGPLGTLVLKYDAEAATLTGHWMPLLRSFWVSIFLRRKVSLKRKRSMEGG